MNQLVYQQPNMASKEEINNNKMSNTNEINGYKLPKLNKMVTSNVLNDININTG